MMNSQGQTRNKTLKKSQVQDLSGHVLQQPDGLLQFLEQEAGGAYKRPWHRLERGLRLNRLRKFSEDEAARLNLKEAEKVALYSLLIKSLDKKLLNSKTAVIYDQAKESIMEIKGLVMHRSSDETVLFQIVDKQKGVTFRRKKTLEPKEDEA
jgi:hypothetical protein